MSVIAPAVHRLETVDPPLALPLLLDIARGPRRPPKTCGDPTPTTTRPSADRCGWSPPIAGRPG